MKNLREGFHLTAINGLDMFSLRSDMFIKKVYITSTPFKSEDIFTREVSHRV